jgi:hypothetical protein
MIPDVAALPLWVIAIVFGGAAAVVWMAGSRLAGYANVFADRTGNRGRRSLVSYCSAV